MRIARTMVTNTLQNTAREKKERKKSISGFFAKKKKPSTNDSIQSKVRCLEKLPAIVLSQGRIMKPKREET
jgi:hypothetical protein